MSETNGTSEAGTLPNKPMQEILQEHLNNVEKTTIQDYVFEVYKITDSELTFEEFAAWFGDMLKVLYVQNNLISQQIRNQNARSL